MSRDIVFDIGNVLIAWDPHAAFRDAFDNDAAIDSFFDEVGFYAWNTEQDRGRARADAVEAIRATHPHHADLMDRYFDRFGDTIRDKIVGSWALLERLRAKGHRIFAITNWGPDTWPMALDLHPQLTEVFEDIVVSGHERVIKPDAAIFHALTDRNRLSPQNCVFIDDSIKNAEGASAVGWMSHHFTTPEAMRDRLMDWGLL